MLGDSLESENNSNDIEEDKIRDEIESEVNNDYQDGENYEIPIERNIE